MYRSAQRDCGPCLPPRRILFSSIRAREAPWAEIGGRGARRPRQGAATAASQFPANRATARIFISCKFAYYLYTCANGSASVLGRGSSVMGIRSIKARRTAGRPRAARNTRRSVLPPGPVHYASLGPTSLIHSFSTFFILMAERVRVHAAGLRYRLGVSAVRERLRYSCCTFAW